VAGILRGETFAPAGDAKVIADIARSPQCPSVSRLARAWTVRTRNAALSSAGGPPSHVPALRVRR
jgi:hypothetical protein